MFDRILIANRGEIACRIARTARSMGVRTVAVYSEADAGARHVRQADEAVFIGAPEPRESYLAIGKIIAAARRTGAEAIHPGYGFLAENAHFREACDEAGLVFIGPTLEALKTMGSKSAARKMMQAAGVPLAPGYHGDDQDEARLRREADAIGCPVMLKPSAGGGGKGMRLVEKAEDFAAALQSCRREARQSFGDDLVLIEKYVARSRHVEVQVFGDDFGDCVSLFDRDCSVQRRHQKIIEEAPAPRLGDEQRRRMSEAAVTAAKAVGYVGAGTVEFLVAPDGAFYFLEMNTRLQVEHPVTEFITGLDLVEWQLRVASGERLPLRQEQIFARGHALEARVYAEDPAKDFLPSTGVLRHLRTPQESGHVRLDAGVDEGDAISSHYDPMIAKLVVHDETREKALRRLRRALEEFEVAGVACNVGFLSRLVASPSFEKAELGAGLIEREQALLFPLESEPPKATFLVAALAELLSEAELRRTRRPPGDDVASPWSARDGWRLNIGEPRILAFEHGGRNHQVAVTCRGGEFSLRFAGVDYPAKARRDAGGRIEAELDGLLMRASVVASGAGRQIFLDGGDWSLILVDTLCTGRSESVSAGGFTAPMSGRVTALLVPAGTRVERGAPLMALEAMKMEHTIFAPAEGDLKSFLFAVGDQVAEGVELLEFEPAEKP